MTEQEMTAVESAIEDFVEVSQGVDRIAKMFKLRRKIYTAEDMEKLRREYFPAFYKRMERAGDKMSADTVSTEIDKMNLQVARDLGRRDPFECQARLILDPLDRKDVLWIFAEPIVSESENGEWTKDELSLLMSALDAVDHAWQSLFDEVAAYVPALTEVKDTRGAFVEMLSRYRNMTANAVSEAVRAEYATVYGGFVKQLKVLADALANHIVIDGDKLDYGEVTRFELGRYSFEDVYADEEGRFAYERRGRLFYIKDNGSAHPYVNQYLLAFDEKRLNSVRELENGYNTFRKLMAQGRCEEAIEYLPVEDPGCELGGVVMKIRQAIEDLKIFARDSVDNFGTIREEAFEQFKGSSTILGESFDVFRADWYRNLAYVSGTDSHFAVIREPLYFLNECWDNLFRWLVRDMKCKFFERAWDAWTRYKDHCEGSGYARPWDGDEVPEVAAKTNALARQMQEAFDDLSKKRLPRFSSEAVDVGTIARDIRSLIEDGSPFLNPTAEDRLGVCLEKLTLIAKACIQNQSWGMLGNVPFIRMVVMMAEIEELDVYKDDGMKLAVKWSNLRNAMDAFLSLLSAQIDSRKIKAFQDWLSSHRKITVPISDSAIKVSADPEVITGFRDMCLDTAVSICVRDQVDALREEYAGDIGWMCEDDDYLELRKPGETPKKTNSRDMGALARKESPFFATKTKSQIKREEKMKELMRQISDASDEYVEPTITDKQLLELGGDKRVIDYLNTDPVACWRYPYYEYLCMRRSYQEAGFKVSEEAEEHLTAFLLTSLDEYDHEFASQFEGEDLQFQIERHDSYKQKYIYDVYERLREEISDRKGALKAADDEKARLDREEELRAEGRAQGMKAALETLGSEGQLNVIVNGFSAEGRKEVVQIVNTKMSEKDWFSDVNLALLFNTHTNTIANWRKKPQSAPLGFSDAFSGKNIKQMTKLANQYILSRERSDVMNTKGLKRNLSEEQIYREKGDK